MTGQHGCQTQRGSPTALHKGSLIEGSLGPCDVREGLQSQGPASMLSLAVGLLGLCKAGLGHGELGPCVPGALWRLILPFEIALKLAHVQASQDCSATGF